MKTIRLTQQQWQGVQRLDYQSNFNGDEDWALLNPPKNSDTWIICIHGHGSNGDQLYTRPDIRDAWLPEFLQGGYGILTPNLGGNLWMNPQAAADMHDLLDYLRGPYGAKRFIFASGSMGGTSNLIYANLYPNDVAAVIALGAASDLASYVDWCRTNNTGIIKEIADAIEAAYGGSSKMVPAVYKKHSVLQNASHLTMPIYLSHGGADTLIPVEQSRSLAEKISECKNFVYHEIPGGNHDSPLWRMADAMAWIQKTVTG